MPELFLWLRIYLDANVLISASLSIDSQFLDFWRMRQVRPITSAYAVEESRRHLRTDQVARLQELLTHTEISDEPGTFLIPNGVALIEKDRPILAAAIFSRADYLITGDKRHFQHLFNTSVARVRIISPGDFLRLHKDRIIL
ncbi:MAG: PIN domain-containing protein [Acidobacteriota bacterium]|nr:PIN domain-containing protein [Acidobacteriota bacterium]